ncbi:MAG: DNA-binding MarR family transcriptional regulator [Rhodoferax sp.]|jgi:DNA-binding MarR family transcriptional regulator
MNLLSLTVPVTPASGATAAPPLVFYSAENYLPEESVGYLMRMVLNVLSQDIERQLLSSGLTNAQWLPLFKLAIGKASTVAELARESHLDAGAMTRLLDRMEAKDLCRRVRSEVDRRVVNIELTTAGQVAASGIPQVLSQVQNDYLSGFSAEEFQTLKLFLRRMLENAQQPPAVSTPASTTPGGPHAA